MEEAFEVQQLLLSLGFPIYKWCSNSEGFLEHIPEEDHETIQSCQLKLTLLTSKNDVFRDCQVLRSCGHQQIEVGSTAWPFHSTERVVCSSPAHPIGAEGALDMTLREVVMWCDM